MLKKYAPLLHEADFEANMSKAPQPRSAFGSSDVQTRCGPQYMSKSKRTRHTRFGALLEVEIYRKSSRRCGGSRFRSQNVQNTPGSEHFWKLRCSKSARGCGAKQVSNLKALTTDSLVHFWKLGWRNGFGILLQVRKTCRFRSPIDLHIFFGVAQPRKS